MKYILIFILVYWVLRRVLKIFAVVGNDQGASNGNSQTNYTPPVQNKKSTDSEKGEYIDFEEIE